MRVGILGEDRAQIGKCSIVVFVLLVSQSPLSQCGRHLRVIWKCLHVIGKSFDNTGSVLRLHMTQPKLVGRFGTQLWGKLRGTQLSVN